MHNTPQFLCLSATYSGNMGWFQVWTVTNTTAVNILVFVICCIQALISSGCLSRSGIGGQRVGISLTLHNFAKLFSKAVIIVYTPTSIVGDFLCYILRNPWHPHTFKCLPINHIDIYAHIHVYISG